MSRRTILLAASALFAGNGAFAFAPAGPAHISTRQGAPSSTSIAMSAGRRNFLDNLSKFAAGAILVGASESANALDFDAFEKGEVEKDTSQCNPKLDPKCKPKLTADEALCQYGNSGEARGEACKRVKQKGGKLPEVKKERSLGGAYAM
ncbi:hypothetical protein ACHAXT_003902 [Thalassiosira profunda]